MLMLRFAAALRTICLAHSMHAALIKHAHGQEVLNTLFNVDSSPEVSLTQRLKGTRLMHHSQEHLGF